MREKSRIAATRWAAHIQVPLNRITLLAVVGGNEVTNPFMVTEVYIKQDGAWKMGSLSFSHLMTPGDN